VLKLYNPYLSCYQLLSYSCYVRLGTVCLPRFSPYDFGLYNSPSKNNQEKINESKQKIFVSPFLYFPKNGKNSQQYTTYRNLICFYPPCFYPTPFETNFKPHLPSFWIPYPCQLCAVGVLVFMSEILKFKRPG